MRKIPLSNKQKEYLRIVYRILISKIHNSGSSFMSIGYKLDIEFINRVLGDLFYTSEDRSRLNDLSRVYKEVV
jgi:hypothetical protein